MGFYVAAVIVSVLVSSAGLLVLFRKRGIGSYRSVLTISITSLVICIAVPLIFNVIWNIEGLFNDGMKVLIAFSVTIFSYLLMLVIGVLVVSSISSSRFFNNIFNKIKNSHENYKNKIKFKKNNTNNITGGKKSKEGPAGEDKEISSAFNDVAAGNNGIYFSETYGPDINDLTVDQCLEKAFEMKQSDLLEDAVKYYMYALDKNPENDIVFWVIVDVCTIYKTLGKADLAKDILESYTEVYRDVMEDNVKYQIEKNLLVI